MHFNYHNNNNKWHTKFALPTKTTQTHCGWITVKWKQLSWNEPKHTHSYTLNRTANIQKFYLILMRCFKYRKCHTNNGDNTQTSKKWVNVLKKRERHKKIDDKRQAANDICENTHTTHIHIRRIISYLCTQFIHGFYDTGMLCKEKWWAIKEANTTQQQRRNSEAKKKDVIVYSKIYRSTNANKISLY